MKEILIAGYYGAGNLGDEAILAAILQDLRSVDPGVQAVVLSWNPAQTRRRYAVQAVHWEDFRAILETAQQAELILVGGGGLFHDTWSFDPDRYLRKGMAGISAYGSLPLLGRFVEAPCVLYSVGIGPLQSELARQHTRRAVERCDLAILRDQHSLQQLKRTGFDPENTEQTPVQIKPDPAFGLTASDVSRERGEDCWRGLGFSANSRVLGVNVRYWDQPDPPEHWLPQLAEGIRQFLASSEEWEVLLLPFQVADRSPHTNDLSVCEELQRCLSGTGRVRLLAERLEPLTARDLIGRCSLWLGMWLHSLIFAVTQGVPAVALPYDRKVRSMMEEVQLEDYCFPEFPPGAAQIHQLLNQAWDQHEALENHLSSISKHKAAQARSAAPLALSLREPHRSPQAGRFPWAFALSLIRWMERIDGWLELLGDDFRPETRGRRYFSVHLRSRLESILVTFNRVLDRTLWKLGSLLDQDHEVEPIPGEQGRKRP